MPHCRAAIRRCGCAFARSALALRRGVWGRSPPHNRCSAGLVASLGRQRFPRCALNQAGFSRVGPDPSGRPEGCGDDSCNAPSGQAERGNRRVSRTCLFGNDPLACGPRGNGGAKTNALHIGVLAFFYGPLWVLCNVGRPAHSCAPSEAAGTASRWARPKAGSSPFCADPAAIARECNSFV